MDSESADDSDIELIPAVPSKAEANFLSTSGDGMETIYDEGVASKLEELDAEVASVQSQISQLQKLKSSLENERRKVYNDYLMTLQDHGTASRSKLGTDYTQRSSRWGDQARHIAKTVFSIPSFRFCQEAVINAALDGRHAVVVMPTGGGKSLCYQLPALMTPGTTLVVSPLISLMTDQVLHLKEVGIHSELLCGSTSREDTNAILKQLRQATHAVDGSSSSSSKRASSNSVPSQPHTDGIKLLYVTPERIAKSKTCLSALQSAYEQGRLSRIVIDEAHCCSQMGHDYRPDYAKLSLLRRLFPKVPIMCLTATCGPKVLQEILEIIDLPPITESDNAAPNRTIYFTAPLFRSNLMYQVVQRPQQAKAAAEAIVDYILKHHAGQSGIVYCLSQADTESTAKALTELSSGRIATGRYHAGLEDASKQLIHTDWRTGKIQVVCATIAFGMGIDKPDVRFVIHACISKSLDGYYQETGRAGRDGADSNCVLFYRPQDAIRLSSLVASEPTGQEKLSVMLDYAQSARCRRQLFADYFSDMFDKGDDQRDRSCGICDNCTANKKSLLIDARKEMYQLLAILSEMSRQGGRVTLTSLSDVARGLGGGKFNLDPNLTDSGNNRSKSGGTSNTKAGVVDVQAVAGGKITMPRDVVDRLIVHGILSQLIGQSYQATAYTVNVYLEPGPKATRFLRRPLSIISSREQLDTLPKVEILPPSNVAATKAAAKRSGSLQLSTHPTLTEPATKRSRTAAMQPSSERTVCSTNGRNGSGASQRGLTSRHGASATDAIVVD